MNCLAPCLQALLADTVLPSFAHPFSRTFGFGQIKICPPVWMHKMVHAVDVHHSRCFWIENRQQLYYCVLGWMLSHDHGWCGRSDSDDLCSTAIPVHRAVVWTQTNLYVQRRSLMASGRSKWQKDSGGRSNLRISGIEMLRERWTTAEISRQPKTTVDFCQNSKHLKHVSDSCKFGMPFPGDSISSQEKTSMPGRDKLNVWPDLPVDVGTVGCCGWVRYKGVPAREGETLFSLPTVVGTSRFVQGLDCCCRRLLKNPRLLQGILMLSRTRSIILDHFDRETVDTVDTWIRSRQYDLWWSLGNDHQAGTLSARPWSSLKSPRSGVTKWTRTIPMLEVVWRRCAGTVGSSPTSFSWI